MQFESWRIFKVAKKNLPSGTLQRIFTKTTRLVDMWAANPAHCEITSRNPIDRIRMLLDALDSAGCEDYAREAIDYMAQPLGGHFAPFGNTVSDRGDVDAELADLLCAAGTLAAKLREALKDNHLDAAERIIIKEQARQVVCEINQVLDAAGMKGVS